MKNSASWSLLDIGGGGDDNDDDDCRDSDNSYDHNHHPSEFELSSSSSLSSVFQVKFYVQWPTNAGFWFEPGCLLNSTLTSAKTVVTILGMIDTGKLMVHTDATKGAEYRR